jgi:hypothetical protein
MLPISELIGGDEFGAFRKSGRRPRTNADFKLESASRTCDDYRAFYRRRNPAFSAAFRTDNYGSFFVLRFRGCPIGAGIKHPMTPGASQHFFALGYWNNRNEKAEKYKETRCNFISASNEHFGRPIMTFPILRLHDDDLGADRFLCAQIPNWDV